jgi:hypothetical protein
LLASNVRKGTSHINEMGVFKRVVGAGFAPGLLPAPVARHPSPSWPNGPRGGRAAEPGRADVPTVGTHEGCP